MKRIGPIVHPSGILLVLCALTLATAAAQTFTTTTVQGTVYAAGGAPASGSLQLTWPAFTTAAGQAVAAGRTALTIGSDGFFSVNLAPNIGATPAGLYYTAVYHMSDGTTSTEYWVVPAAAQATLSQVRAQVMPAAQAAQAVSKAYVDQTIQETLQGQITVFGGSLTGPLYLPGDPSQPTQAADKHYVDGAVGGALPLGGGVLQGPLTGPQLGAVYQADQFPGSDFGARLQACVNGLNPTYGGVCDARNFTGALTMAANLTLSTPNATVYLPCSTLSTAASIVVPAGTRNVTLHGCASRGTSASSGSQGGTVILYSGGGAAIHVGDPAYAADTLGFHLDNLVVNTTAATAATAQALAVQRTQEISLSGLYLLGNPNQTGITLDGTGNYTGGTVQDVHVSGFQTAVNAIGHQVSNPATTDWLNASTFVRLHIDCPTANGNPIAGTIGVNLQQGDGNTFTGGDIESCATALHLGANAQNNTLVGLRNENSTSQVTADAGNSYNNWITGGTMFTGKLTDNGTRNSFLDTFHRSFNSLNGDWYGSQQDATVTNHFRLGTGAGNERGLYNRYQTDSGYRWTTGLSDATAGEQFYQVLDELNNVYRLSIGQYNPGQPGSNNQTAINAAGTGAVVLNGSSNAGTGGVVVGSGGAASTTVATIDKSGNAQFNGTLQVAGAAQSTGTMTVRNNADAEVDYYLWPGLTANQKGSFTYKDFNGNSQWYLMKDASNNWALNSALGGLDSFKAYQSTNSGDTYINASNGTGAVRINYESGSGAAFNIYGGNSTALYAGFTGPASIKFPGLAASSGHNCLQIDNSGWLSNAGAGCGTANSVAAPGLSFPDASVQTTSQQGALTGAANDATARSAAVAAQTTASAALPANGITTTSSGGGSLTVPGTIAAGSANPTTLGPTFVAQYNSSPALAPSLSNVLANQPAVNANLYKPLDTAHSGTDYGAAINGAIAAQPLMQPSKITAPTACQPIWEPVVTDRPASLDGTCVIPEPGGAQGVWGAPASVIPNVTLTLNSVVNGTPTAGSTTITATNLCALLPTPPPGSNYGIAIGGYGLPPDDYIVPNSCSGNTATLALPAERTILALAMGASPLTFASSLVNLTTSNTLNTLTSTGSTTLAITSFNYATNAIAVTGTVPNTSHMSVFFVGGPMTSTLTAQVVAPAVIVAANGSALVDFEGQGTGRDISGLTIWDPGYTGTQGNYIGATGVNGRTLTGLQGLQMYGCDECHIHHLWVQGVKGAALIMGGMGKAAAYAAPLSLPTRENGCDQCNLLDSGDWPTGQSVFAYTTPPSSAGEDENNVFTCSECHLYLNHGQAQVDVTTYNSNHWTGSHLPRQIRFDRGSQIENGGQDTTEDLLAPCGDLIHLGYVDDFYYEGTELNGPDCGGADVATYHAGNYVGVSTTHLINYPVAYAFQVHVTSGSGVITYISGGQNKSVDFGSLSDWNGRFIQFTADGTACTTTAPCNLYLAPVGAMTNATTLNLPSGVTYPAGSTGTATMTIGAGGVMYAFSAPMNSGFGLYPNDNGTRVAYTVNKQWLNIAAFGQSATDVTEGLSGGGAYYAPGGCIDTPTVSSPSGVVPGTFIQSLYCLGLTGASGISAPTMLSAQAITSMGAPSLNTGGCSYSNLKGGNESASFTAGATSCTFTATFTQTPKDSWDCHLHDYTTPADSSTFTVVPSGNAVTFSGTAAVNDVISFGCQPN